MASKSACPLKAIPKILDAHQLEEFRKEFHKVVGFISTIHGDKRFGVMLFKEAITKENLLK
ncbi:MAG TPA: hypothetical protein PKD85_09270 [Saprospiraceae bacterium]|nr:hypothetical protein [Saprospiraceae bacterium]